MTSVKAVTNVDCRIFGETAISGIISRQSDLVL